jgi:LDH2 family malate/lactate/ureidoglycolate dehydrogenase
MTFPYEALTAFAQQLLERSGVPPDKANLVAVSLTASNLRGVDSHGLQLLPQYLEQIKAGNIQPEAGGRIISESGACLLFDGERAFGQHVAAVCSDHAVRLCRVHGLGMAVARESNHYGAAAFWSQRIAGAGCIGITVCNASSLVAPWQGKQPRLGTNPISVALPGPRRWLLDMATTTVAMNKIVNASLSGRETIPPGWAMDAEGNPTTSTAVALKGLLMPLGGYKGSGLAMMVEILCGVLSGGAMSTEVGGVYNRAKPMRTSQMFLAIDPTRFLPMDEFVERITRLVAMMKSSAPAAGFDEVMVAGDPEWRSEEERRRDGIPLSEGAWTALRDAALALNVPLPSPAS